MQAASVQFMPFQKASLWEEAAVSLCGLQWEGNYLTVGAEDRLASNSELILKVTSES